MTGIKILCLCHNHPSLHPGGTEIFALDLFRELKRSNGVEGLFIGCTDRAHRERRAGTVFQGVGRSADEMLMWTGHFDTFYLSQIDLHGIVPELTALVETVRPDIIHVHHVVLMGLEPLVLLRRVAPRARIVLTLHDYYPICPHDGLMVTVGERRLCHRASPDACHSCFPGLTPERFVLRAQHVKTHFRLVDRFIAPSAFLKRRYVEWGLPDGSIEVLPNAVPDAPAAPHRRLGEDERRGAFAYLGNLNPNKGVTVLLAAMRILAKRQPGLCRLAIHGGMPFQSESFQTEFKSSLAAVEDQASWRGPYERDEVPRLLAEADWLVMPSIWWENAPLVIQEAFRQRRPVIASDIGGMAEAVRHETDGLLFRVGDPHALAEALERAAREPGLWERLVAGIEAPTSLAECAAAHWRLYTELLSMPHRESA